MTNKSATETPAMKRKRIIKRNKLRTTLCWGCRFNYYNFPKGQSENGDVEVPQDYSCWSLNDAKRGKCSSRSSV